MVGTSVALAVAVVRATSQSNCTLPPRSNCPGQKDSVCTWSSLPSYSKLQSSQGGTLTRKRGIRIHITAEFGCPKAQILVTRCPLKFGIDSEPGSQPCDTSGREAQSNIMDTPTMLQVRMKGAKRSDGISPEFVHVPHIHTHVGQRMGS